MSFDIRYSEFGIRYSLFGSSPTDWVTGFVGKGQPWLVQKLISVHLIVHGEVQGVGFRAFAKNLARSHHLPGWVRNRGDGTVEIQIDGDSSMVEAFLNKIREGPRFGFVSHIEILEKSEIDHSQFSDFSVRY